MQAFDGLANILLQHGPGSSTAPGPQNVEAQDKNNPNMNCFMAMASQLWQALINAAQAAAAAASEKEELEKAYNSLMF